MRNLRTALAPTPTWKAVPRADIPGQRRLYGCAAGDWRMGSACELTHLSDKLTRRVMAEPLLNLLGISSR